MDASYGSEVYSDYHTWTARSRPYLAGRIASRKMLVERLYPMLNRHKIAGADGEAINIRWENQMREAAAELDRLLGIERPPEADASVN